MKTKRLIYILIAFLLFSCNNRNINDGNKKDNVNLLNPTLMIFPSDALLKRLGCLKEVENQGTTSYDRNYSKAFIQDSELKFVIASIEESFSKSNYPLENLEQNLKQINDSKTMDAVDGISTDAKTLLMNTARPDFIIEIDYEYKQDPTSRNPKKILTYLITAINAYTNKTIASITRADIGKDNEGSSLSGLIKDDLSDNIADFQKQINQHFSDMLDNGIEITFRISTDENANLHLGDECLGSVNYNDWVNDWLKQHTINSSFKSVISTEKELKFTNVRIKSKTEKGEKYTAFDFTNDLKKDFSKACGVSAKNQTQGIADAYLVLTGLK